MGARRGGQEGAFVPLWILHLQCVIVLSILLLFIIPLKQILRAPMRGCIVFDAIFVLSASNIKLDC